MNRVNTKLENKIKRGKKKKLILKRELFFLFFNPFFGKEGLSFTLSIIPVLAIFSPFYNLSSPYYWSLFLKNSKFFLKF